MLQGHWKDPSMTAKYLRDKHQITTDTVQHLIKQLWQEWNDQDENASSAVSTDMKMTASLVLGGGTRTRVSRVVQLEDHPAENEKANPGGPEGEIKVEPHEVQDAIGPPPTPCRNVAQGPSSFTTSQWTLSP